jgi:hypothetical protein
MSSKSSITKKKSKKNNNSLIPPLINSHYIPFLDRPLPTIMSILRYMQLNREDKENGMYYTTKNDYPFDPISKKQMEIFGNTFTKESNAQALIKINPIPPNNIKVTPKNNNQQNINPQTIDVQTYSRPIGPLTFLRTTVPQYPEQTFLKFLEACSK